MLHNVVIEAQTLSSIPLFRLLGLLKFPSAALTQEKQQNSLGPD